MSNYFDKFPVISYNINKQDGVPNEYQLATNIFVRLKVLSEKLDQVFHYYEYTIKEQDNPENLAERLYGTPEAHWLILLTNTRYDAFYDWPMNYDIFKKYITGKYGSVQNAQVTDAKWQRVLLVKNVPSDQETKTVFEMSEQEYMDSPLPVGLGDGAQYIVGPNNISIFEYKEKFSAYDVEDELNESRRNIKVIKKEYFGTIQQEFLSIMGAAGNESIGRNIRSLR